MIDASTRQRSDLLAPTRRRTVIKAKAPSRQAVGEVLEFRHLLFRFAQRDIILRYRQTAIGVAWVIIQPLLAAGVLSFVFGSIAGLKSPNGVPYFVFSYFGYLVWSVFASSIGKASSSVVSNASLVSKVFFPRVLLPLATCGSTVLDFLIGLGLGLVLLVVSGVGIGWHALFLIPVALLALVLGLGVGLFAAALMVAYRDVQFVVPVVVQFLLYFSPVSYGLSNVPASVRGYTRMNPLVGVLETFRWAAFGRGSLNVGLLLVSLAVSLVCLAAGVTFFHARERKFADVI